jgi:hypothetical protein
MVVNMLIILDIPTKTWNKEKFWNHTNCQFVYIFMYIYVGTSHSATGAIESALKYMSPDAHWIARRLATAGGKRIKTWPLSAIATSTTRPVTTSHYYATRQQQGYVSSDRRPARGPTTCPVSAEPARALPTSANLCSAEFTSATAHRQLSADQLSHLPTRCPPNPACWRPSGPGKFVACNGPFQGHHSPFQPTSAGRAEDLQTPSATAPFRATDSKQCRYHA